MTSVKTTKIANCSPTTAVTENPSSMSPTAAVTKNSNSMSSTAAGTKEPSNMSPTTAVTENPSSMSLTAVKTKNMVLCSMFVVLIIAGAFIKIPVPVVPFTLQFLFTMLAGLLLGGKNGFISVCVYIFIGLVGLPVFAQGGGIGYILQPSFGYIIGFAAASYVTGTIASKSSAPGYKRLLTANFIGLFIVYLFGMVYYYLMSMFYVGSPIGLWPLFLYCFILAVPGDILLCIIGAILGKRLIPLVRPERRIYENN